MTAGSEHSAVAAAVEEARTQDNGAEFFRLGPEDIAEVAALEKQCFSMPWQEKQFRLAFEQKIFSVFGLRRQGVLVAYIAVYMTHYEIEVLNIASHPEYRRQGLAKRLLGLLLRIGEKMGIESAVLEVRRTNIPAIRLYESFGFTQCGVRRHYYTDTNEDALVYNKELGAGQA